MDRQTDRRTPSNRASAYQLCWRPVKLEAESCIFPTDISKFPTEEIWVLKFLLTVLPLNFPGNGGFPAYGGKFSDNKKIFRHATIYASCVAMTLLILLAWHDCSHATEIGNLKCTCIVIKRVYAQWQGLLCYKSVVKNYVGLGQLGLINVGLPCTYGHNTPKLQASGQTDGLNLYGGNTALCIMCTARLLTLFRFCYGLPRHRQGSMGGPRSWKGEREPITGVWLRWPAPEAMKACWQSCAEFPLK